MHRICDLLLINRIWQSWWEAAPLIVLSSKTVLLGDTLSITGLEEAAKDPTATRKYVLQKAGESLEAGPSPVEIPAPSDTSITEDTVKPCLDTWPAETVWL